MAASLPLLNMSTPVPRLQPRLSTRRIPQRKHIWPNPEAILLTTKRASPAIHKHRALFKEDITSRDRCNTALPKADIMAHSRCSKRITGRRSQYMATLLMAGRKDNMLTKGAKLRLRTLFWLVWLVAVVWSCACSKISDACFVLIGWGCQNGASRVGDICVMLLSSSSNGARHSIAFFHTTKPLSGRIGGTGSRSVAERRGAED